jgi:hypothetical protein
MAQTTGFNLPVPQSPFVDAKSGVLSYDGYQYLLSLLTTAANAKATSAVATGLVAQGTNQATALQLTSDWNVVQTVPSGTGVVLAALQAGQTQVVFNQGANPMLVYPSPGSQINSLGTNLPFTLAAGSRATFEFVTSVQIYT